MSTAEPVERARNLSSTELEAYLAAKGIVRPYSRRRLAEPCKSVESARWRYLLRNMRRFRKEAREFEARWRAILNQPVPTAQEVWDRIYNPVYDKAWADHAAGTITVDEAIERTDRAGVKANRAIQAQGAR